MFLASILRSAMRVIDAIEDTNRRKAEREIARVAHRKGG